MKLKIGDKVKILAGKEKGKTGTIVKTIRDVNPDKNKVIVEGLNIMKHFVKAKKAGDKSGIIDVATAIHASNVALLDKKAKKVSAEKKEKAVKPATKKKAVKKAE